MTGSNGETAARKRTATGLTRRALLLGTGAAAGALGTTAIWSAASPAHQAGPPAAAAPDAAAVLHGAPVAAVGAHQSGITRPSIPQGHCIVAVAELDTDSLESSLRALGEQILRITDPAHPDLALFPDGPGDLTVAVGLGPRALAATRHPSLQSAVALPVFRGDEALPADRLGGDIFLSVNASDPAVLEPALASLTGVIAGYHALWSDFGFRAASDDDVSRNPFGYHDGIIVPRTAADLAENVWISDGALAGGTICVIRRFSLDTVGFRALPADRRDAVIGRRQASGVPLSGGERGDAVNLSAKADTGELLVPARAHSRAAHPSFTGSGLMLRRSYAYRASDTDHGLVFIAFQREAATFSRTQLRLDEVDDLMGFATPTATGAFAILPGMDAGSPMGFSLFQ
ncbi:iron uptake transporter deferrochelatase/peroxidase subunit [Leifsonia kafniensis]|uniref:Iron uptake transporter deferrochelatase/peroxidase subunit n=1 Tax=Leifsonia kafniensis TaxID=475957 RepID=A0ABP7L752_9MICO